RRRKGADRVARHRERKKLEQANANGCVTEVTCNDVTRYVTPSGTSDTDPDRARAVSIPGSHSSSEPSSERSRDLIQASSVPAGGPAEMKMLWPIEQRIARLRKELAAELGLPPPRYPHPTNQDLSDALARLRESGADAEGGLDAVFSAVEGEV